MQKINKETNIYASRHLHIFLILRFSSICKQIESKTHANQTAKKKSKKDINSIIAFRHFTFHFSSSFRLCKIHGIFVHKIFAN